MTAGFNAFTDAGEIIITENYTNLRVIEKKTVTLTGGSGTKARPRVGTFDVFVEQPTIAFYAPGCTGLTNRLKITGGWRYTILSTNSTVEVFIFDRGQSTTSGGNFGLQVFKEDGTIAFDSSFNYSRIESVASFKSPQPYSVYPNFNDIRQVSVTTGGRKYAVALSYTRTGYTVIEGELLPYRECLDGVGVSGNTASLSWLVYQDNQPHPSDSVMEYWDWYEWRNSPPKVIFYDVTGI